jgi:hypothetical protein
MAHFLQRDMERVGAYAMEVQLPVLVCSFAKMFYIPKCRSLSQTIGLFATPEHLRFSDDAELHADYDEYLGDTSTVTKGGSIPRYQILPTPTKSSPTTNTTVTSTVKAVPMPLKQQFSETWPARLLLLGYLESLLTDIQTSLQALGNFSSASPLGLTNWSILTTVAILLTCLFALHAIKLCRRRASTHKTGDVEKRAQHANVPPAQPAFDTAQLRSDLQELLPTLLNGAVASLITNGGFNSLFAQDSSFRAAMQESIKQGLDSVQPLIKANADRLEIVKESITSWDDISNFVTDRVTGAALQLDNRMEE